MLAQKVLRGETKGYKYHPQLRRFKKASDPEKAIASFLHEICQEAERRGFHFDRSKIESEPSRDRFPVTSGQLRYEFHLLCKKMEIRDRQMCNRLLNLEEIESHPLFYVIEGDVADWEKIPAIERKHVK